ncbi:MAG: hypothetical protein QM484_12740 [Woeseiaceae bacterium]
MSIKEHVTQEVKKIAVEGKAVDDKVIAFVKSDFHQTLADCEKTGHSIKQATQDTLEGVQTGLKAAGHKTEDIVSKSADGIVDVTRDITTQSLDAVRSYADDAKALLNKAVEKSFDTMDKVEAKTKAKMEKAHDDLQERTIAEKQRLAEISEGIIEHAESKTHEMNNATRSALHKSAKRSKTYLNALVDASEKHSKALLHHSHAKVSDWLGKLNDKVHHKA